LTVFIVTAAFGAIAEITTPVLPLTETALLVDCNVAVPPLDVKTRAEFAAFTCIPTPPFNELVMETALLPAMVMAPAEPAAFNVYAPLRVEILTELLLETATFAAEVILTAPDATVASVTGAATARIETPAVPEFDVNKLIPAPPLKFNVLVAVKLASAPPAAIETGELTVLINTPALPVAPDAVTVTPLLPSTETALFVDRRVAMPPVAAKFKAEFTVLNCIPRPPLSELLNETTLVPASEILPVVPDAATAMGPLIAATLTPVFDSRLTLPMSDCNVALGPLEVSVKLPAMLFKVMDEFATRAPVTVTPELPSIVTNDADDITLRLSAD